jgi:hypothetical protein
MGEVDRGVGWGVRNDLVQSSWLYLGASNDRQSLMQALRCSLERVCHQHIAPQNCRTFFGLDVEAIRDTTNGIR